MEENGEEVVSKKEKEELVKEERAEERPKSEQSNKAKKAIGFFIAIILIVFLGSKLYKTLAASVSESTKVSMTVLDSDRVRGNKDAKVALIEYSDFQCPACGVYYTILKDLEKSYPNDLKIIYRNFPLTQLHKNAMLAAKAAEAAGRQDKFWEMHDLLFEKQADWSEGDLAKDKFQAYAKEIDLDEAKWLSDLDSKEVNDKISSDVAFGNSLAVNSTPTFYLNGKKISPRSLDEFKKLVDKEIKSSN